MTPAETQLLLGIAASFDNRKPSEEGAIAWSHALGDLRFEDCRHAVMAHYQRSREWLMPVDVIAGVKALRQNRLMAYGPTEPPANLDPDNTDAYAEWQAETNRRIADGELIAPEPSTLTARDIASLGEIGRSVPRA